jgi:hypothetical protein
MVGPLPAHADALPDRQARAQGVPGDKISDRDCAEVIKATLKVGDPVAVVAQRLGHLGRSVPVPNRMGQHRHDAEAQGLTP